MGGERGRTFDGGRHRVQDSACLKRAPSCVNYLTGDVATAITGEEFDQPRGSANFDRIAPRRPDDYLCISEVFHKTFLILDEKETEAAAATAVAMSVRSAVREKPKPIEVRVDHPFLFAIQHRSSGACLFLGRVSDPR